MTTIKIVNIHHKTPYDVYIGRGSVWGNPFSISDAMTREYCINAYRHHLWGLIKDGSITIEMLQNLKGKTLGCFCKPNTCHGDIIIEAVRWSDSVKHLKPRGDL